MVSIELYFFFLISDVPSVLRAHYR